MVNKSIWGLSLLPVTIVLPAAAHTIEATADVAATFHIEPDHNPKAGQPSQAWFALTLRGGQPIPFDQCNCQLTVYAQPALNHTQPLLTPTLQPISTEQYQDIPSALITFPKPGLYELRLKGTPQAGATFQPFEFRYGVTAIAGSLSSSTPQSQPQSETSAAVEKKQPQALPTWKLSLALGVGVVALAAIAYGLRKQIFNRKVP